jgi:hypothetical protein
MVVKVGVQIHQGHPEGKVAVAVQPAMQVMVVVEALGSVQVLMPPVHLVVAVAVPGVQAVHKILVPVYKEEA